MPNQLTLFTHTDLDGIGCSVLAKLAFGAENVAVDYCDYDNINTKVEAYFDSGITDDCHITDIRIDESLADRIDTSNRNYLLFDHHPQALDLDKFCWCNVGLEDEQTHEQTSGTEIYYRWLIDNQYLDYDDTLDKFVRLVTDYDTWRWSTLGEEGLICKQVNSLLYLYGRDKFIDWCIESINNKSFPTLTETDLAILEVEQRRVDKYIEDKDKQLITKTLCGRTCGIVFAETYFSELGNRLSKMHPELDFIAMISMDGTISYRTVKDDIHLGHEVAKYFGGGGHAKAAGSQFSASQVKDDMIDLIFYISKCSNSPRDI